MFRHTDNRTWPLLSFPSFDASVSITAVSFKLGVDPVIMPSRKVLQRIFSL